MLLVLTALSGAVFFPNNGKGAHQGDEFYTFFLVDSDALSPPNKDPLRCFTDTH